MQVEASVEVVKEVETSSQPSSPEKCPYDRRSLPPCLERYAYNGKLMDFRSDRVRPHPNNLGNNFKRFIFQFVTQVFMEFDLL